jgi:hypothetical protein
MTGRSDGDVPMASLCLMKKTPHKKRRRVAKTEKCEKYNCSLDQGHDGWHVKKVKNGKVVISWLDGHWKTPDGQEGTYCYVEPLVSSVADIAAAALTQEEPYTGGEI